MQKIIFILISILVSSCGDLFMTDSASESFGSNLLGASCKFDSKRFALILEENIKGDILCLENKLNLFISFVKTDRPGFISKKTLLELLETEILDVGDEDPTPIIDSLFDISYVIFGGDNGYISEKDIGRLIDFLIYFNGNISKFVTKYFKFDEKVNFNLHEVHRDSVEKGISFITGRLYNIMAKDASSRLNEIDSNKVLESFFREEPIKLEKVRSLMFLKTIFFGGDRFTLTTSELEDITSKLPKLAQVALDLTQIKNFTFKEDLAKMTRVFNSGLANVQGNLFYDYSDNKTLFSIYEVLKAYELLTGADEDVALDPEAFNLRKYPRELLVIKKILLGNDESNFKTQDMYKLLGHGRSILDEAEFFFDIYEFFQNELDTREPISRSFSEYEVQNPTLEGYRDNFARIIGSYKYFKGNRKAPIFGNEYYRNAAGAVEIRVIEYLAKLIMETYGEEVDAGSGLYHMNLEKHVLPLVDDIKRLLRDFGLVTVGREIPIKDGEYQYPTFDLGNGEKVSYTPEVVATGENLVLMATLFQNQSNGCDKNSSCMEVPEITEFLVGVLTAMSVQSEFNKVLSALCGDEEVGGEIDHLGRRRYTLACLKNNFISILEANINEEGDTLNKFMPRLYDYVKDMTADLGENQEPVESTDYNKFLNETDAFTRRCRVLPKGNGREQEVEIKLTEKDAFGIFAGLLNVESTLLRFDTNDNNKMDDGCNDRVLRRTRGIICKKTASETNEVNEAYLSVYEGAIKSLVKKAVGGSLGNIAVKLSKQIFQYLIKEGAIPSGGGTGVGSYWHFAKFLTKVNKKANADRTTIATILKTLGEQSENAKKYPFKCEECSAAGPDLRCEPADNISWDYDWTVEE